MVIVSLGKALVNGDSAEIALDTLTFLGAINRIKKEDYARYVMLESGLKAAFEEEPDLVNEVKEFAINMTELFN